MKNRSRIALLIVAVFMLGAFSITAYQSTSKIITLVDDKKVTQYETDAKSVNELLEQLEVTLGVNDTVEPDLETEIEDNMTITIQRWQPTVTFICNGESVSFKTNLETVGEIIKTKGLESSEKTVEPAEDTKVTDGMTITVKTKSEKTVTAEEEIAFESKVVETDELLVGETKVSQKGQNGVKENTVKQQYYGDELVSEEITSSTVVTEPVDEIILKGTKQPAPVKKQNTITDSRTGKTYAYTKSFSMETTAYTSNHNGNGTVTASGKKTFVGMVAVDTDVIPLGSVLYIEGYGIAIAGDTGGAINGNIVDLFFNSASECYQYGRQYGVGVYVLEDQSINVQAVRSTY